VGYTLPESQHFRSPHRPIDRLLVAQAIADPLKLLTVDKILGKYSDLVVIA
jgi:PIN domain nuclease of toxin-antitoxin system